MGDSKMGHARLMSQALRKLTERLARLIVRFLYQSIERENWGNGNLKQLLVETH
jgi:RecA/RadA recombinase